MIADYSHPALEGTNVLFSCPHGLVLTGLSASVCMGDGEWEPDPSQIKCSIKFAWQILFCAHEHIMNGHTNLNVWHTHTYIILCMHTYTPHPTHAHL